MPKYGPDYEVGFVGKWELFQITWRSGSQTEVRNPDTDYNLTCCLPGIKTNLGSFGLDSAKVKAAKVFDHWHKNLIAESVT